MQFPVLKESLTRDDLVALLRYDENSGDFYWLASGPGRKMDAPAGADNGQGYIHIGIRGFSYRAHRLAFLYMTGAWPSDQVDHVNGIRPDNKWSNLRNISGKDNTHNQRLPHKHNSTGFLGVKPSRSRFTATINLDGKRKHLGVFKTAEKAHEAYLAAKRQLHASCTI